MTQEEWARRHVQTVASQVRRYRTARGMSAQGLADACAQLGYPIPRGVLANLENGRRDAVTVAELLVLAAALDVPPLLLVLPVEVQHDIEVTPGTVCPTWQAADWFAGLENPLNRRHRWRDVPDPWKVLPDYRWHEQYAAEALGALFAEAATARVLEEGRPHQQGPDDLTAAAARRRQAVAALRRHREQMRDAGEVLPSLLRNLSDILDEEPGTDEEARS